MEQMARERDKARQDLEKAEQRNLEFVKDRRPSFCLGTSRGGGGQVDVVGVLAQGGWWTQAAAR